jgi:DNA-3-methyladenine glycosylase
MFGTFGSAYVYRIYGIYHCLNVVAPAGSRAAAILIRAMEPLYGLDAMANSRSKASASRRPLTDIHSLLSGPGKICQAMEIGLEQNTLMLTEGELFVSEGQGLANHEIAATPRIGLNRRTCGDATDLPWRYVHRGSPFLSRPT